MSARRWLRGRPTAASKISQTLTVQRRGLIASVSARVHDFWLRCTPCLEARRSQFRSGHPGLHRRRAGRSGMAETRRDARRGRPVRADQLWSASGLESGRRGNMAFVKALGELACWRSRRHGVCRTSRELQRAGAHGLDSEIFVLVARVDLDDQGRGWSALARRRSPRRPRRAVIIIAPSADREALAELPRAQ